MFQYQYNCQFSPVLVFSSVEFVDRVFISDHRFVIKFPLPLKTPLILTLANQYAQLSSSLFSSSLLTHALLLASRIGNRLTFTAIPALNGLKPLFSANKSLLMVMPCCISRNQTATTRLRLPSITLSNV